MEAAFRARRARAKGVPAGRDRRTCGRSMRNFSAYAYSKAHAGDLRAHLLAGAVAQGALAGRVPRAVLRNEAGFYPARAYVEEARRLGCRDRAAVRQPLRGRAPTRLRAGVLRLGLSQVKGLREGTPEELVRVREAQGPYLSLDRPPPAHDARARRGRAPGPRGRARRLRPAARASCSGTWRSTSTATPRRAPRRRARGRRAHARSSAAASALPPARAARSPSRPTTRRRGCLELEVETLGLTATAHPLALVRDAARAARRRRRRPTSRSTSAAPSRVAGWVVTDRRVRDAARLDPVRARQPAAT